MSVWALAPRNEGKAWNFDPNPGRDRRGRLDYLECCVRLKATVLQELQEFHHPAQMQVATGEIEPKSHQGLLRQREQTRLGQPFPFRPGCYIQCRASCKATFTGWLKLRG